MGSIRKVPRANGFAWEFRFYCSDESGERKLKTLKFDALKYSTETAVRKAVEPQLGALNSDTLRGKISATMKTIIDRYYAEEFPSLRHSTQSTNRSLIELHICPKFGNVRSSDLSAILVKNWLDKCEVGATQKARARNIHSKRLYLAMLWEYIPVQRNPMQLIRGKRLDFPCRAWFYQPRRPPFGGSLRPNPFMKHAVGNWTEVKERVLRSNTL